MLFDIKTVLALTVLSIGVSTRSVNKTMMSIMPSSLWKILRIIMLMRIMLLELLLVRVLALVLAQILQVTLPLTYCTFTECHSATNNSTHDRQISLTCIFASVFILI